LSGKTGANPPLWHWSKCPADDFEIFVIFKDLAVLQVKSILKFENARQLPKFWICPDERAFFSSSWCVPAGT